MSYRLTDWAMEVPGLTPPQKLVLLALAYSCNGQAGSARCWPSQARLCELTGLSERALRYGLRELEARHLIACEPGTGKTSTRYRLAYQDSPNARLDLPEPKLRGAARSRAAGSEGQEMPPNVAPGGQEVPPRGARDAGRGARDAAGTGKEQGREQGGTERDSNPESRAHAREPAAGAALSQPPGPRWRVIAAAVRPDLSDADAVRAKFEAYHRGRFADQAAEDCAWELWLLRERTTRSERESKQREAGGFLNNIATRHDALTADYEVIHHER